MKCLREKVSDRVARYETEQDEEEKEDPKEEDIGTVVNWFPEDSLIKLRGRIHQEIEVDRVPIKFHFLRQHASEVRSSDYGFSFCYRRKALDHCLFFVVGSLYLASIAENSGCQGHY